MATGEVTVVVEQETVKGQRDADAIDIGDLRVISGCCCGLTPLYCDMKNCWGCNSEGDLLCLGGRSMACKPSAKEDRWCIFLESECYCAKPKTCAKLQSQCFFCDSRVAFPCTEEVPCIVNYLGLTCAYNKACKVACCKTLADIDPEYSHEQEVTVGQAYGAPKAMEIER